MTPFHALEPESSCELGPNTRLDASTHPPRVDRLHVVFRGWLGGCIVETFPCFLVSKEARDLILAARLSGCSFDDAEVTIGDPFDEDPERAHLPRFVWLRIEGRAGVDDFGLDREHQLIVSANALAQLNRLGLGDARPTSWPPSRAGSPKEPPSSPKPLA